MVLVGILCVIIVPFTVFTALLFFPFLMLVVGFIYRWFTIASKSATWGMRMMGIELRDHDGLRLHSQPHLCIQQAIPYLWQWPRYRLMSVLMMLLSERKQGLTDHLLGTTAINKPRRLTSSKMGGLPLRVRLLGFY